MQWIGPPLCVYAWSAIVDAVVELMPTPVQGRVVSGGAVATETNPEPAKSTITAEAMGQTGRREGGSPAWARVAVSRL